MGSIFGSSLQLSPPGSPQNSPPRSPRCSLGSIGSFVSVSDRIAKRFQKGCRRASVNIYQARDEEERRKFRYHPEEDTRMSEIEDVETGLNYSASKHSSFSTRNISG